MATVQEAIASMAKNIEEKTGKSVKQWVVLARGSGFAKHGEILKWLKEKHGMGHGYANYVAKEATKSGDDSDEGLVSAQFAGAKSALRPLYDELIGVMKALGPDVEIAPKKNNVSIRRSKQFALLQPSTTKRIDVGLILKDVKPEGRLLASGSFNAMFTHRVGVESGKDIDAELKKWLKAAYRAA
jgi:hypothetical protein